MRSLQRRRILSRVMTTLTTTAAMLAIIALILILGYIAVTGGQQLSLSFLINDPKPVGEADSGIANAIVGTLVMIGIASAIGLPIGILAGLYLAEFSTNRFGMVPR